MPRAALGQKGLKNQYFAISYPLGSGRPKRKMEKSCAILGRNFWGGRIFSPKVPLAPGNCPFLFSIRNFSECQGAALGQKCLKNLYLRFPALGSAKTQNVKKLHNCGEKLLGRTGFSPKCAPSSGKLRFSGFGPQFL